MLTFDEGRATGRTTRLVKALPPGAAFIVSHSAAKSIVFNYIRVLGREKDDLYVYTVEQIPLFGGTPIRTVGIDHTAEAIMTQEDWSNIMSMFKLIFTTDKQGDVVTTGGLR